MCPNPEGIKMCSCTVGLCAKKHGGHRDLRGDSGGGTH